MIQNKARSDWLIVQSTRRKKDSQRSDEVSTHCRKFRGTILQDSSADASERIIKLPRQRKNLAEDGLFPFLGHPFNATAWPLVKALYKTFLQVYHQLHV